MFNNSLVLLNNIETRFTIKDLENFSGIKAHTIRIWEKRYGVLEPNRTESNIRYYSSDSLKKLLNVTLLYNAGHKISKIAALSDDELKLLVKDNMAKGDSESGHMDALVLSMLTFNQQLFEHTFSRLVAEFSFRHVFVNVFVPLLYNIGLYWQSDSVTPAHEHFMSNLIKQKLHIHIERVQQTNYENEDQVYVLFLPENEIHELGLLYLHYELHLKGMKSIYLGQSVPMSNLAALKEIFPKIQFVSYFTIQPEMEAVPAYLEGLLSQVIRPSIDGLWVTGRNTKHINLDHEDAVVFKDLQEVLNKMNTIL